MKTIEGKCGIKATVLADSISEAGVRLLTFEIEYPRIILAEANTHRMLSRNSASSRAIPFSKMVGQLHGRPVRFGQANPGMQDKGEDFHNAVMGWPVEHDGNCGMPAWSAEEAWEEAKEHAIYFSEAFYKAGYHKQVYNRLTESFQMMKTVVSGTELSNFFWLRDDDVADPTIAELARCMREAKDGSEPQLLKSGQWHLPYVYWEVNEQGVQEFFIEQDVEGWGEARYAISLEDAIKVSCARCAAVSYRNEGYTLEKCKELYERLVGSDKKHASALEHCATPMHGEVVDYNDCDNNINEPDKPYTWEKGISHMDKSYQLWSGNLKGWIQYRKTIDGENYEE